MDYSELLVKTYQDAMAGRSYADRLNKDTKNNIKTIAEKSFSQKGVFTVLITLAIYKMKHPTQDIRIHQSQLKNGFSGRSIDTKYITPILKKLELPSMSESGWLTRSLEQPYPYTLDYEGKIGNIKVKNAFLQLIFEIEVKNIKPKYILTELFKIVMVIQKQNKIKIQPLLNPEKLTISKMISLLENHFFYNYKTFGGSKLPVLAFYAIYKLIIQQTTRYNSCFLKELGSHTASDRSSKSAGDIEVFKNGKLFEAIEIKLDKPINENIARIAKEKIVKFNPKRYYLLSCNETNDQKIDKIISEVKKEHGCQIIVNGVIPTLKYYMRLVENLEDFYKIYSKLIEVDSELKPIHKKAWNDLTEDINYEL